MQVPGLSWLVTILLTGACLSKAGESQRPSNRTDSLTALCQRLDLGAGAVIADVGCGDGSGTLLFAGIVGKRGTVLAQEIEAAKLKTVVDKADGRGFHQVVPVLGRGGDPHLPDGFANLIVDAYHRLWEPLPLLQRLKEYMTPAGLLAVLDRKGLDAEPRRLAEHRRRISGPLVVEGMRQAGFDLRQTRPTPAEDRFFLVFGLQGLSSP